MQFKIEKRKKSDLSSVSFEMFKAGRVYFGYSVFAVRRHLYMSWVRRFPKTQSTERLLHHRLKLKRGV